MPLLEVRDLVKHFSTSRGTVQAVNGVSFGLDAGATLSLVGESGCGKTTIARCVLRLIDPSAGRILFEDRDVGQLDRSAFRPVRARLQMVFQDPSDSLNPRMRVGALVEEPLTFFTDLSRHDRHARVRALFRQVQLHEDLVDRFPRQLSGGQQQRVAIARAIATGPALIVLDEPTSALDVSVRSGILELLQSLQESLGIAYLLISHDLTTVERLGGTIAVLYLGRIVELGTSANVLTRPSHPYTQGLLASRLTIDATQTLPEVALTGEIPSAFDLPSGCPLLTRCPEALPSCAASVPQLLPLAASPDHRVACLRRPTLVAGA